MTNSTFDRSLRPCNGLIELNKMNECKTEQVLVQSLQCNRNQDASLLNSSQHPRS